MVNTKQTVAEDCGSGAETPGHSGHQLPFSRNLLPSSSHVAHLCSRLLSSYYHSSFHSCCFPPSRSPLSAQLGWGGTGGGKEGGRVRTEERQRGEEDRSEITTYPQETHLEALIRRNETRQCSRARASLVRSRSMGSLQNSAVSIGALKALFESKAVTQNDVKSSFRAASFTSPHKAADIKPVMNGEAELVKEEPKTQIPADTPVYDVKTYAKEHHVTQKVVNQTRMERRKTVGGIDFEKITASQADEKRRSIADFRDSSFVHTKENLSVSVKAMSALYLSKVGPQESTRSLKPAQDQSSESGKRAKLIRVSWHDLEGNILLSLPQACLHTLEHDFHWIAHCGCKGCSMMRTLLCSSKMAEDSQQRKDDVPPHPSARHQPGPEDISGAHFQQPVSCQLSKEKLYQQRQKCELRRLLKHTHPELKKLDEVVDEELAEVLSTETGGTADDTGYEGEVLSRRLIFENCAVSNKVSPYSAKMHTAEGTMERGDVSKSSAVFEEHDKRQCPESVRRIVEDSKTLGFSPDPNRECEEEDMMKIDVQATRRMFESQLNTSRLNPDNKFQGKQKQGQRHKQSLVHNASQSTDPRDPEEFREIKTSAALFQNNPFISTNVEKEHSFAHTLKSESPAGDSEPGHHIANVKNRAHLFESMPFDKIRHQNKDEIETMVENIKDTLNSLYHFNAIHSDGSIIEVNETMIAKKAKFTLSEGGPKIRYDEVAEGGAQNFILHLLPRANRKPQITYLKEHSKGNMVATVVNVPVHQHHLTNNQDTEFKTANVLQVVEDILNQDNSLRKGVILQEDVDRCAEVIVYSLFIYFDENDVKSYCPPIGAEYVDPEPEGGSVSKTNNRDLRKGVIESTISCLLETSKDPTCQVNGNVKLFRSCIEKGDLEYLKTLQTEPTMQEQELPPDQNMAGQGVELHHEQRGDQAEENTSEWVPVDVKRLKNMFSGDQRPVQPKQNVRENQAKSSTIPCASTGQKAQFGKSQLECSVGVSHTDNTLRPSTVQTQDQACNSTSAFQRSHLQLEAQDDGRVHQAEFVEVVDDSNEISNLQSAIHSLQQATIEAKSVHQSRTDAELPQETEDQKQDPSMEPMWDEVPSASNITTENKSDHQHENKDSCCKDTNSEEVQTTVSVNSSETTAAQEDDDRVDFHGKLQAALDSLERSNINVTRGDFRAAMIYRNSSKPHKESVDTVSVQTLRKEGFCPVTELKSCNQSLLRDEVSKEQVTAANAELPSQNETLNKADTSAVLQKGRRPVGPKPALPPKPEHLTQREIQSTNTKNPEAKQTNTVRPEDTVPQPLPMKLTVHKDEHKQDLLEIKSGANSGPDTVDLQKNEHFDEVMQMSQEIQVRHQVQGSVVTLESDNMDENIINQRQTIIATAEEKSPVKENVNETDETHVDFHAACSKFGGKKAFSAKNPPVKPKRVKIAKPDNKNSEHMSGDNNSSIPPPVVEEPQQAIAGPSRSNLNTHGQSADSGDEHEKEMKQESKVEMREKKGRTETEDERRQRLSVHMDEIMRGNITTAMEIFDNLRKQEELRSILSRVEEIEQDTSEVDVSSLRGVFENVPDWVVSSSKKKQKKVKVESKEETVLLIRDNTESKSETKSSMAHVFGDLERASEEIMNLKEQTLARLMDIEGAIKKALYSVSTLKSESDIAGLSCLFKESLGTVQGSPSSGNISKISIGSSRTKSLQTQRGHPAQENTTLPVSQSASTEAASAKQRASPPSSPAFISIQSAARKTDEKEVLQPGTTICSACQHSPKTEEKFRTTKTLTCNSPAKNRKMDPRKGGQKQSSYNQLNPNRELSVLEVQTDHQGNSVLGTKIVTENYERTDNFGNRFYSSKTSTVVTTKPETTTSTGQAVVSPATYQVTKYPEVRLPINQKP
ncbi:hypothetical protein L3Q82_004634 [Scortum barcoo]|uniref:Uncharacterized protein n=1 Tax=Scortum barcoo TaxID=214431 RepID=A0ACB8VGX9_9TELE|nr:hypothetical protein L3Q82_004634 [Scortum barcoo]